MRQYSIILTTIILLFSCTKTTNNSSPYTPVAYNTPTDTIPGGGLYDFATVRVGNTIYLFGGYGQKYGTTQPLDSVKSYNILTRTWTSLAPLPSPGGRGELTAVNIGDSIYCIGGISTNQKYLNQIDVYSISGNNWRSTPITVPASFLGPNITGFNIPVSAAIGSSIYIFGGGLSNGVITDSSAVYNTSTGAWTRLPAMPAYGRYEAASFVYYDINDNDSDILIAGGGYQQNNNLYYSTRIDVFNTKMQMWEEPINNLSDLPFPGRLGLGATLANNNYYFAGGSTTPTAPLTLNPLGYIDVFDQSTAQWKERILLPGGAVNAPGFTNINNYLIILGGDYGNDIYSNRVDIYNIVTKQWLNRGAQ